MSNGGKYRADVIYFVKLIIKPITCFCFQSLKTNSVSPNKAMVHCRNAPDPNTHCTEDSFSLGARWRLAHSRHMTM